MRSSRWCCMCKCVYISLIIIYSGSVSNYGAFYLNGLCFPAQPHPHPRDLVTALGHSALALPPPRVSALSEKREKKRRATATRKKGRSEAQVSFACRLSIRHQTAALRGGSTRHFWALCVDPQQLYSLFHVFDCTLRSLKFCVVYLRNGCSWKCATCSVEFSTYPAGISIVCFLWTLWMTLSIVTCEVHAQQPRSACLDYELRVVLVVTSSFRHVTTHVALSFPHLKGLWRPLCVTFQVVSSETEGNSTLQLHISAKTKQWQHNCC